MPQEICLLCKRPAVGAGHHPKRDMLFRTCPTCGPYYIDPLAVGVFDGLPEANRFNVIAAVRGAARTGQPVEIADAADLQRLASEAPRWRTLLEGVDRLLLLLAERASAYLAPIHVDKDSDYPLICARGAKEMNELQLIAKQLGYLETSPDAVVITVKGWTRVDELRAVQPNSRQAFVAMWFDHQLDEAWAKGFKVGIERSKYFSALRVDAVQHNEKVDDLIIAEIRRSGLVVADFTGNRPGVYFEAGYARGLGIPVIWTCRADYVDQLHFDTRQYNHIKWETPSDLAGSLHDRVSATALPKGWLAGRA